MLFARSYQKRLRSQQAFQGVSENNSHDATEWQMPHRAGMFVIGALIGLAFWALVIGGAVVFARFVGWL